MRAERLALFSIAMLLSAGAALARDLPGTAEQREACTADIMSQCRMLRPGGGRLLACVSEKFVSFSPECREAIAQSACGPQADPRLAGRFPCEESGTAGSPAAQ